MGTYHYSYRVKLQSEQRRWLETMTQASMTPAKHYLVARVLLMSDQSQGKPSHTDGQIAEVLSISRRTAIRIKQRFVQGNLEVALTGSLPRLMRASSSNACIPRFGIVVRRKLPPYDISSLAD